MILAVRSEPFFFSEPVPSTALSVVQAVRYNQGKPAKAAFGFSSLAWGWAPDLRAGNWFATLMSCWHPTAEWLRHWKEEKDLGDEKREYWESESTWEELWRRIGGKDWSTLGKKLLGLGAGDSKGRGSWNHKAKSMWLAATRMEGTEDLALLGTAAGAVEGNRETVEGETQKWMWSLEVRKQTLAANDKRH